MAIKPQIYEVRKKIAINSYSNHEVANYFTRSYNCAILTSRYWTDTIINECY